MCMRLTEAPGTILGRQTVLNGVDATFPGGAAALGHRRRKGNAVTLVPANPRLQPMVFNADEVQIFGRVVTVMRRL